jgi:L-ribulose-5-phosphate 4-epimerase
MKEADMVVVDADGCILEGSLRPSSDLPTHLVLYRQFATIGGIVHTHSTWATVWAQACRGIPALGTTHADYFFGEIPCTEVLTQQQTAGQYEAETGQAIIERFRQGAIDPVQMPAVLVANHGPFTWGVDANDAVHHAAVLELTARMALLSLQLDQNLPAMPQHLLEKHFFRKHGPGAYYGQG